MPIRMAQFSALVATTFGLAFAFAAASASATVCSADTDELAVADARLLAIGDYRGPPASDNAAAQRFFEQGLVFGWGFNSAEAVRSFRTASRIDAECALCRWGVAWALGSSINHDMRPADMPVALDAITQGRAYAKDARERMLIDALAMRYSARAGANADQLARSYANAMRILVARFPDDADIAVLTAEAMMNAHAYDYWKADGQPKTWTPEIVRQLDRALQVAPDHPGAHHYRIHLFEESPQPERALSSADKLGALAPMAGHLVHMPAHIFFRLGRYHDAVRANQAAVQADRDYSAATGASSAYATHNLHFLWASALWSGDREASLSAADALSAAVSPGADYRDGTSQHFLAAPLLTRVRLAQWDGLATPTHLQRSSVRPYHAGLAQFAAGMAFAARGDVAAARAELYALRNSQRITRVAKMNVKHINQAADVLNVARLLLQSAIAAASASDEAVRYARAAVAAEDRLAADDPPVWLIPARHVLGAALLSAGSAARTAEAAAVYRADLRRHPNNTVALAGLAAAEQRLLAPMTFSASAR